MIKNIDPVKGLTVIVSRMRSKSLLTKNKMKNNFIYKTLMKDGNKKERWQDWDKAYAKTRSVIWSCNKEEHLEAGLRMVINYERLMQNFGPTSVQGRRIGAGTVDDLLSLIKLKRKMIRRG